MSRIDEFHSASMDLADIALNLKREKDPTYIDKFKQSLEFEIKALSLFEKRKNKDELTRSILYRSAATLALDCNEFRTSEKLINKALSFDPPEIIAEELRDLLEQVYFNRHLELKGIALEDEEFQFTLSGRGVGFGLVHSNEFLERVDNVSKMFYRIGERRLKRPFREKGQPIQDIKSNYEVFLSVPRAASFAVTMKIGKPTDQQKLPGIIDTPEVIEEFIDLMNDLNSGNEDALIKKIPDEAYRANFIQLGKRVAPDGDNISQIGFTYRLNNQIHKLNFTREKSNFYSKKPMGNLSKTIIKNDIICGILRFADETKLEDSKIKIIDDTTSKTYLIHVPPGLMNDIVKPLWGSTVRASVIKKRNSLVLEDIDPM